MKKIMILAAAIALFASCAKEETAIGKGSIQVDLAIALDQNGKTKAATLPTIPNGYKLRYVVEVYNSTGVKYDRQVFNQDQEETPEDLTGASSTFMIAIPNLADTYSVVVWADYTNGASDLKYNTSAGLTDIQVVQSGYVVNDPLREAFFGKGTITVSSTGSISGNGSASTSTLTISCKRAVAQLSLYTTDITSVPTAYKPVSTKVAFTDLYSAFNALTGTTTGATWSSPTFQYDIASAPASYTPFSGATLKDIDNAKTALVFQDYVLAPAASANLTTFDLTLYSVAAASQAADKIVGSYADISNVPLQNNYKTNVLSAFMTLKGYIAIDVDGDWAGSKNVDEKGSVIPVQ